MATYVTGWQAGDLSIHPTELAADRHDNLQHEQVLGAVSPEALAAALDNAMTGGDQRSPLEEAVAALDAFFWKARGGGADGRANAPAETETKA